jgi:hypothetical protein
MHSTAATLSKLCELSSLILTSMVRDQGHRGKQKVEERRRDSPVAQVHTWPAWRGSARAADQARPRDDFTAAPPGAPQKALPPVCTHSQRSPRRSIAGIGKEAGGMSRLETTVKQDPERDPTMDLLGEEAAGDSTWWSW